MIRAISKYWLSYPAWQVIIAHMSLFVPTFTALVIAFMYSVEQLIEGEGVVGFIPKCSYLSLTGDECYTCGLSRAFSSIAHGEFSLAVEFNSFAWLWFLVFCTIAILSSASLILYIIGKVQQEIE